MRSLQVKFSALVVTLLLAVCLVLAWIATQHERRALEGEVEKRGLALAENLAVTAREPLVLRDELRLVDLVRGVGRGAGVAGARIVDPEGRVVASLVPEEQGTSRAPLAALPADGDPGSRAAREPGWLHLGAPILLSGVRVGEAQVDLDLRVLVDPVVRETAGQLAAVALVVILVGVAAGLGFVTLLVGPLRRLRAGVERLTAGDLEVRVPPTSRDEVGELTRAFNEMGESLQQKQRIQQAFGRYASDWVLSQLLQGEEDDELAGAEREVTVLFADIRRFTRLSEGMKARDVVALLNRVFQLASDCILARGGTIDKFIGDSVMAYFGAPVAHPDHAQRAVAAAIDLMRVVAEDARETGRDVSPLPDIGIGVHTGAVVVGNIGSDRRTDFTAIGDAVNVAHRLEKLAGAGEILVSEAVQRRVRGAYRLRFEGERQLSGRVEPVHVYSVEIDDVSPPAAAAPR